MGKDETAARIAELEADNRRLRRLLDQNNAPGELRHRLRNTISLLRAIIVKSAQTERDLETYVSQLQDRLEALIRAQAAADDRGGVALAMMVAEELLRCGALEGERVSIAGPDIEFAPRAGQVFALALHELAINAVEHGALGSSTGRIEISWTVDDGAPDKTLAFVWKERDEHAPHPSAHKGFGTELLTHSLPYELNAQTAIDYERDGLRCAISVPLTAQNGWIAGAKPHETSSHDAE